MKIDRVKSLISLRRNQETRLDSLYNRRQNTTAKRVEQQIDQANKDITVANIEIDTLNNQIQRKASETSSMDLEILNLKNSDVNGEVGPLKYIAKLTGKDMDSVVNFFILMLIFVFDPLAVSLVIATNMAIERELGKKEEPNLVKAVVDVEKEVMAVDAELHSDEEAALLEEGSSQENLWGINLYPEFLDDNFVEFDSMINLRPSQNNRSRDVEDPRIREKILKIVNNLVER